VTALRLERFQQRLPALCLTPLRPAFKLKCSHSRAIM
jgi:hypothetical protein